MSKPIYRARFTTKTGAYRVREFLSLKNAEAHARQMENEGAYGYIERVTAESTRVMSNWGNGSAEKEAA